MKKTVRILSLLLVCMLAVSFTACNAATKDESLGGIADGGNGIYNNPSFSQSGSSQEGLKDFYVEAEKSDSDEAIYPEAPSEDNNMAEEDMDINTPYLPVWKENPFINTAENNISTFSADVDTASYTYFRKLINQGYRWRELANSSSAFRTEEFINYFKYDVQSPRDNELFGVTTDIVACPWNESSYVLRLTLKAEEATVSEGNNLVFLIDVSGSMRSEDKLPLLKKAFSTLVGSLSEKDRVSIVTYSGREQVVLDGCEGNKSERIMAAINSLNASGSTNGEAGLTEAYRIAEKHFIEGGNNRIIMASDGDLNVGISSAQELQNYVEQKRGQGVYLSVLGFGTGNYRDANMEAIADHGNGVYYYIDGESEAERVMGTDLLGTLYTVAEDVKMQLTFDKDYVKSYRLIGYENRLLDTEDFEDDTKDAGEVGASHQVTVCYEITFNDSVDMWNDSAEGAEWIKLAVRYKNPGEPISLLNEYSIGARELGNTNDDIKFMLCVIQTTMLLHNSEYIGDITIESVIENLQSLDLSEYPERVEFLNLLEKSIQGKK